MKNSTYAGLASLLIFAVLPFAGKALLKIDKLSFEYLVNNIGLYLMFVSGVILFGLAHLIGTIEDLTKEIKEIKNIKK